MPPQPAADVRSSKRQRILRHRAAVAAEAAAAIMDARARLAELDAMNIYNMDIVESRPLRRERKKLRKLLYRQKGKFIFFFFFAFFFFF